jgi:hypothetical protein
MKSENRAEPTPEQLAWDARSRRTTRNSRIATATWVALTLGSIAWVIMFSIMPGDFRAGAIAILFILMIAAGLSLQLTKFIGHAEWALGKRPSSDFKYREPKPIDMEIEQISEDVQRATVGEYIFEVKTLARKSRFRQGKNSYRIQEANGKINEIATLDYSLFRGMTDEDASKYIRDFISMKLEDRTDYFENVSA